MIQLIVRTFVKNYKDVENHHVREAYGKLTGIVGIISNIILFIIKFTVGILFKSISVTADAVNNLSDAGSSIITLIGFKLSGKPGGCETSVRSCQNGIYYRIGCIFYHHSVRC